MINWDRTEIERLLLQLDEGGYWDLRYKFYKENNEFHLLGFGSFSYVYEMYDSLDPEKRYAAKVIGVGGRYVDPDLILETAQLQFLLSRQSDYILKASALWGIKLQLDDDGNLTDLIGVNEERYEDAVGPELNIILMEKLDSILSRDKYGNTALLREDLRTEAGVISFARQIGSALTVVHNNAYIHRDIKLENIFWDPNIECYKLGDFGIARYVGDGDAETVVFTDGYGAPEIERKLEESYNITADIYSFGVTLYLLLNDLKFPASDGYHINFIAQYSPDFIFPAPAHASEGLARIVQKMCSYRYYDRYQSVEEVLTALEEFDQYRNKISSEGAYMERSSDRDHVKVYEDFGTETYREPGNQFDGADADTETYCDSWDKSGEADTGTETYHDPKGKSDGTDGDIDTKHDWKEDKKEEQETEHSNEEEAQEIKETWIGKPEEELTREERKKRDEAFERGYSASVTIKTCIASILFFALFKSLVPGFENTGDWHFWTMAVILLIESVLLKVKEFHIEFGVLAVLFAGYTIMVLGADVPEIIMLVVILTGSQALTAGCAIGTGLWVWQMISGKLAWLSFLSRWDLGWIVIIFLEMLIWDGLSDKINYMRSETILDKIWQLIMFFIHYQCHLLKRISWLNEDSPLIL